MYYEVYLHRRHLVQAVIEAFGPFGSHGWRIDAAACMRRGQEFAKGVVQGFVDSEGSVDVRGSSIRIRIGTVNRTGMLDMILLLKRLGYVAPLGGPSARGEYRVVLGVQASVRYALEIGSRIEKKALRMRTALSLRAPERLPTSHTAQRRRLVGSRS